MLCQKVIIITDDLIRANHLLLILAEVGIVNYKIISKIKEARQLQKYGGYDLVFVERKKIKSDLKLNNFIEALGIPIVVMGKKFGSKLSTNLMKSSKLAEIHIPFVKFEIKTILNNLFTSENDNSKSYV